MKWSYHIEKEEGVLSSNWRNELMKRWARDMLDILSTDVTYAGEAPAHTPTLLVGNHISYLDIPLLLTSVPVAFVAKNELGRWPVFGSACRRTGTVLVKRHSAASRHEAAQTMAQVIKGEGRNIVIFPSGTTCLREEKPWRHGSFRIAKEHGIPLQPFRLTYEPLREVAYIDRDFFPLHLLQLLKQKRIKAHLEFGKPRLIQDVESECAAVQSWTREIHGKDLWQETLRKNMNSLACRI